jgi:hypothetical protein
MSLITTIEEIKKYIAIDGNSTMVTMQPYLDEAQQIYLVELLGQPFIDALQTAYDSASGVVDDISDNNIKALFPYVQRAFSYYALLLAIPHLTVSVGDMGVRTDRSDESDPAPRWQIEKLQLHYLKNGDIHADKLLAHLEATATGSVFPSWFNSTFNTKNSGFIVYSTAIASRYISINNSRRVFLSIRNKIREIEQRSIPKLIGAAQYAELVAQLRGNNVSANNALLIGKLEPIISKQALYMQLPFMRVQVADNGIFLYSQTDEIFKNLLASPADIKLLQQQLKEGDFGFDADIEDLRQFLLDNIDNYPLVKSTGVYTSRPVPGPTWQTLDPLPDDKYFAP